MSPEYVHPYVKSQKNDDRDAEAIAEAATRPTMRFVPVKSEAQSDIQALHRARERLVVMRTALINHLRALLLERGIVVPQGRRKLEAYLGTFADEDGGSISPRIRQIIEDLRQEWRARQSDERIAAFDQEFVALARTDETARRLTTIPGIGTINATALMAAIGHAEAFARGRDMAAWLGLTPGQMTTGGKPRLLGIGKRGDRYLRTLLIHGARAALGKADGKQDPRSLWLCKIRERRHPNVVAVALANKNARIIWAMLADDEIYKPEQSAQAA